MQYPITKKNRPKGILNCIESNFFYKYYYVYDNFVCKVQVIQKWHEKNFWYTFIWFDRAQRALQEYLH